MTSGLSAGVCLSLTGRFAQFGRQAANGLRLWANESGVDLTVLDDESDPAVLAARLPVVAASTDVLFGPYSTVLMRAAIPIARQADRLLFNHGGSGGALDHPGLVVNVLTPARRYADPFISRLAAARNARLFTASGRGTFGRHIINGGRNAARDIGLTVESFNVEQPPVGVWDLLSAGVYEDDVATLRTVQALPNPPRYVCSVAAGVAQFSSDAPDAEGVFGVGQWAQGDATNPHEAEFLSTWRARYGATPDYPGVQAYASGAIALAAVRLSGSVEAGAMWRTLVAMEGQTVFGRFRLDPATGEQVGHAAVLTQWCDGEQVVV